MGLLLYADLDGYNLLYILVYSWLHLCIFLVSVN